MNWIFCQRALIVKTTYLMCVVFVTTLSVPVSFAAELGPIVSNTIDLSFESDFPTRQGGDTFEQAMNVTIPFFGSGTTVGFSNVFDYSCPWGAPAPDVIYRFSLETDLVVEIDLWGSQYDTRLFVLDEDFNVIDCNNDQGAYIITSYIGELSLIGGQSYYVVVDGEYADGEYLIRIEEDVSCEVSCAGEEEGEPLLAVGYDDQYNSGCAEPQNGSPVQELLGDSSGGLVFCGKSGWYFSSGEIKRDIDWFLLTIGSSGVVEFICTQEERAYLFHLGPLNCEDMGVLDIWSLDSCNEVAFSLMGEPGSQTWVLFRPQRPSSPSGEDVYEFDYQLSIQGLETGLVATDALSWGAIKALYK